MKRLHNKIVELALTGDTLLFVYGFVGFLMTPILMIVTLIAPSSFELLSEYTILLIAFAPATAFIYVIFQMFNKFDVTQKQKIIFNVVLNVTILVFTIVTFHNENPNVDIVNN